jgi:hypothetical protein
MSGMDPHMISWNMRWVWFGLVGWFVEVDLIRLWSVTVRLRDAIEVRILRSCCDLKH